MMSTKQMVLALLVSAQIASAAEGVVVVASEAAAEQVSFFSGLFNSGKDVVNTCVTAACDNKKAIAAVVVASGVSAVAYYNWDRVQNAYNKAVAYVKENQEAIVANLKVGGAVLGATGVVAAAGYAIYEYLKNTASAVAVPSTDVVTEEVNKEAPVTPANADKFNSELVENLV